MTTRLVRTLAMAALAVVGLSACSFQGLAFVQDQRLEFVSPEDRELVELPVTIDWEIEDFEVVEPGRAEPTPGEGYFGVFVDSRPQPPGKPLSWHARDDETCDRDPECPDAEWYRVRGIHTTVESEFTIERMARPSDETRREIHTITVILLDADGVRIGESAWQMEIEIDRPER